MIVGIVKKNNCILGYTCYFHSRESSKSEFGESDRRKSDWYGKFFSISPEKRFYGQIRSSWRTRTNRLS